MFEITVQIYGEGRLTWYGYEGNLNTKRVNGIITKEFMGADDRSKEKVIPKLLEEVEKVAGKCFLKEEYRLDGDISDIPKPDGRFLIFVDEKNVTNITYMKNGTAYSHQPPKAKA